MIPLRLGIRLIVIDPLFDSVDQFYDSSDSPYAQPNEGCKKHEENDTAADIVKPSVFDGAMREIHRSLFEVRLPGFGYLRLGF